MQIHLKVKVASLAAEARNIRSLEKSLRRQARWTKKNRPAEDAAKAYDRFFSLRYHRVGEVRPAARHSHLAYGFLRGVSYKRMEQKCFRPPNFREIEKVALRFAEDSPQNVKQHFAEWLDAADVPPYLRPKEAAPAPAPEPGIIGRLFGGSPVA